MNEDREKLKEVLLDKFIKGEIHISQQEDFSMQDNLIKEILDLKRKEHEFLKSRHRIFQYAAVAAFILFLSGSIYFYITISTNLENFKTPIAQVQRISIGKTQAWLNHTTGVQVNEKERLLTLDSGEVYISNHNTGQYLQIVSGDLRIFIVNGEVNIFSRDGYRKVSSKEGQQKIDLKGKSFLLQEGKEFKEKDGKTLIRQLADKYNMGSFASGNLYYENEPISFILTDLEKALNVTIHFGKNLPSDPLPPQLFSINEKPLEILKKLVGENYTVTQSGPTEFSVNSTLGL